MNNKSVLVKTDHPQIDLSASHLKNAISKGKALIQEGKTKADAARLMYSLIHNESKEVIVAVFVEGDMLYRKWHLDGSATLWYLDSWRHCSQ